MIFAPAGSGYPFSDWLAAPCAHLFNAPIGMRIPGTSQIFGIGIGAAPQEGCQANGAGASGPSLLKLPLPSSISANIAFTRTAAARPSVVSK